MRRFYPFFPFVGGRGLHDFDWQGHHFPKNTWMLLDLWGTNHDERTWGDPWRFRPERFADWDESPYDFIPQGGGYYDRNHRCAGEWVTVALMLCAVQLLVNSMAYEVPPQDLGINLAHMPAIPNSRFVISSCTAVGWSQRRPRLDGKGGRGDLLGLS